MINSLRTKRKLGFIDGTLKRLSSDSVEAEQWDMVNAMIIGWIYSSVEPKLRPSISLVDSAKAMWASLQRRFSVNNDTRVLQLLADINNCKQDGDTVEIFFGRLKVMWDDLADLDKGFTCCCGTEKILFHQFLMGFDNSRFGTTHSNILSQQSEINLDMVYSQIVQEERYLNVMRGAEERIPVMGLSATTQPQPLQHSAPKTEQAAAAKFSRPTTMCTHCGKTGHEATSCFYLIGFPEWYNDKKSNSGRPISLR
ncbi:hypothetical protein EUTSA_v10002805mg, partial [Eutrema salsugineum]